MAQIQFPFGPGDPDEKQPALLLGLAIALRGSGVRQEPLLDSNDEHNGEFQPLGGVQGHERDRAFFVFPAVDRRGKAHLFHEVDDRRTRMLLVELFRRRYELVDVRLTLLARSFAFIGQKGLVPCEGEQLRDDLLGRVIAKGRQFVDQKAEIAEGVDRRGP